MLFRGIYSFLSNMHDSGIKIKYKDLEGTNVESIYQACKLISNADRKYIVSLEGKIAKRRVRDYVIRSDWDDIKLDIMYEILCLKFNNIYYKQLLLSTGDVELIETNFWNDYFWGMCNGKGENHLGKLLMRIRDKYSVIAKVKKKLYIGDLYNPKIIANYDYIGFTANNVLNSKNELVMGKGNALTVKKLYPDLPKDIAPKIKDKYLIAFHNNIFAFQSKYHYRDDSDLKLITQSVEELKRHAKINNDKIFALPVPGTGNGNLGLDEVLECFIDLPSNIHLWTYPRSYYYTGIGTRGYKKLKDIPDKEKEYLSDLAKRLSKLYTCRTGDAPGTDTVFKMNSVKTDSYIPWENFNGSDSTLYTQPRYAKYLASLNHPYWDKLTGPVIKLMSRNSLQVLGDDLITPSDFIICYTLDGCNDYTTRTPSTGGTGLAISLASKLGIPVYNITNKSDRDKIETILISLNI